MTIALAIGGGMSAGLAQTDPASLLVGKREGTQQQAGRGGSEDRTLIVSGKLTLAGNGQRDRDRAVTLDKKQ